MKYMRKRRKYLILLVLILAISLGYAALATTLKVKGTLNVSKTSWDVHLENINIEPNSVTASVPPTSDNTTTTSLDYTINITNPGDFYEFSVDVVNKGTLDAMIDVVTNKVYAADGTTEKNVNYLKSTVTYADGVEIKKNHLLEHGKSDTLKVRIEFRKDIEEEDLPSSGDETLKVKFEMNTVQADENAINRSHIAVIEGDRDNLQPGDKVVIDGTENFYVLSSDNSTNGKTMLLAKYNLLVGNIYENYSLVGEIPSSTEGYNKQSSEAVGNMGSSYKGTVEFAPENTSNGSKGYWSNSTGSAIVSPYNKEGVSYSSTLPYVYDSNSSIYQYVERYKTILEEAKVNIEEARLLSYEEANNMKNIKDGTTSIVLDGTKKYWLGSASYDTYIKYVYSSGYSAYIDNFTYYYKDLAGVRPVIIVNTSEFKN